MPVICAVVIIFRLDLEQLFVVSKVLSLAYIYFGPPFLYIYEPIAVTVGTRYLAVCGVQRPDP